MSLALLLSLVAAFVILLPLAMAGTPRRGEVLRRVALVLVVIGAIGLVAPHGARGNALILASLASASSLVLHVLGARTRNGRLWLGLAALCAAVVAVALMMGRPEVAFGASLAALTLRTGVLPLHAGVFAVAERHPGLLVELFGSAIGAVLVHQRIVEAVPDLAAGVAVPLVAWGAGATLVGALLALAQTSLRGLWASSVGMHAGMLFAAVGAAGRGHGVAALLVVTTLALAMGGFGFVVAALEARVGRVMLTGDGGRVRAFPTLAAAFAFFAGAGVGLPGTAGFIADDLLLHALWEEGAAAAVVVVVASAVLAVALLRGYGAVFLGPPGRANVAHDLRPRERFVVAVGLIALVTIGVYPMVLVGPAAQAMSVAPAVVDGGTPVTPHVDH